jgi:putative transcriptional regulator
MQYDVKPGDLLVAPPGILDHRFKETVLLVTDHDHKGSVGLVLNRATEYQVNDLITPLDVEIPWNPLLFWGGPVCQEISFMLHSPEWRLEGYSRSITADWAVTQHWSMFVHLGDGDEPQHWRIFAGCCAWAPGQLDREIQGLAPSSKASSWLVVNDPPAGVLLGMDHGDMWAWACDRAALQTTSCWMA